MSARVGEAGSARPRGPEARREARGFGDYLEAARRAAGVEAAAGVARRAAAGGEAPGAEAGASPGAALSRRRGQADGLDQGLFLGRGHLDGAERGDLERRAEAMPAGSQPGPGGGPGARDASPSAPAPRAADLAAAVERLAVAVERRDRALGPELRLELGGRLSVLLSRGERGVEVVFGGDARMARLAEAEMPAVLARLRERGIAVSRCEARLATGTAAASGPGPRGPTRGSAR